jgi:hypothetical protein
LQLTLFSECQKKKKTYLVFFFQFWRRLNKLCHTWIHLFQCSHCFFQKKNAPTVSMHQSKIRWQIYSWVYAVGERGSTFLPVNNIYILPVNFYTTLYKS